eukprot:14302337-Heterocapsa_arctica.AAC.1
MNNDEQEEDQVHRYVHEGLLRRNVPESINRNEGQMTGRQDVQQNTPEVVQDGESAIDTQEYGHIVEDDYEDKLQANDQMGGQTELTQEGMQKQEDIVTQDYKDHHIMEDENEVRKANKT